MKNNLKISTMCENSFLKIQSFQIYNGRAIELKYYCGETFEWRAATIQSFWKKIKWIAENWVSISQRIKKSVI